MKKRIVVVLTAVCLLASCLFPAFSAAAASSPKWGITVDSKGTFRMNGKAIYAYGVNEYLMAWMYGKDPFGGVQYKKSFAIMQKYNIPVARFPLMHITNEQAKRYEMIEKGALDDILQVADLVVAEAEKTHVGLIISLFFSGMRAQGEKISALGDPYSKTMQMRIKFTKEVVARYKNSPAVWGWEVTNETNLSADLPNADDRYECFTSAEGYTMVREVAKAIREVDDYRMISTGDAILRESARSLHESGLKVDSNHNWTPDWTRDTVEDFRYMINYCTPDPTDTVSMHMGCQKPNWTYKLADKSLTFAELLKEYVRTAKASGKGFFFGEFGDCGVLTSANADSFVKTNFPTYVQTMVKSGVQLGTMWQFNGDNNEFTDEGLLSYMLAELQKTNAQFKQMGLQNTDEYWKLAASSTTTTTKKPGQTTATTTTKRTNNSAVTTKAPEQSGVTTAVSGPALETYMQSASTKLAIADAESLITVEKPIVLEKFKRSIALREGYTLSVLDAAGQAVSDDTAVVDAACTVKVFDPDGRELRQFAIAVSSAAGTTAAGSEPQATATSPTVPADNPNVSDKPGWVLPVCIAGGVVILAAAGAAVYVFVIKKKQS